MMDPVPDSSTTHDVEQMAKGDPSIAAFVAAMGQRYSPRSPRSFWDCQDLFHQLLANRQEIEQRLNDELRHLVDDPSFSGNWLPGEWVLHRGGGFILSISMVAPRRFVHVVPFYGMYGSIGADGLTYEKYQLPGGYRNEVFDPSLRLERVGLESVASGQVVRIESDSFAYDFRPVRPVPVLKLMTSALRTLEWLFTRDSLRAWQANDADLTFTQLRVAADVLGRFAHQSSLEPLKAIAEHPHHAVRWSAIQNLARVNRSEAVQRLRRAVADAHPHIRAAAAKTLERMQRKTQGPG